jgi:PAS domain S-box-containing protein
MQAPTSGATVDPSFAHVHRLLDLLPAGACLCDAEGRITHYTAQAADLWGHHPDLVSAPPRWCGALRLFDEDGRELAHHDLPIAHALREGRPHHGRRLELERPDGERRHALSYASPLLDEQGTVVGGLDLLVDVTDRHRAAQAERERLRTRGEELVALACDIRAGLTPLRQGGRDAERRAQAAALDEQLRHITRLVDRVLNLEVDAD